MIMISPGHGLGTRVPNTDAMLNTWENAALSNCCAVAQVCVSRRSDAHPVADDAILARQERTGILTILKYSTQCHVVLTK